MQGTGASAFGQSLWEVLALALPERQRLQRELNTVFRQQLPRCFLKGKRSYSIALDITLIPYHGQPHQDEKELVRGEAKSGTTHFHGYATVSIVHDKRRYVIALRFIEAGEESVAMVRWLLNRLKSLGLRIRRLYMDKGFCAIPVFRTLKHRKLSYVIPIPLRGKSGGARRLFQGTASYQTTYTFRSPKYGTYPFGQPQYGVNVKVAIIAMASSGSPMRSQDCQPGSRLAKSSNYTDKGLASKPVIAR